MTKTAMFAAAVVASACLAAAASGAIAADSVADPVPGLLKSPADVARGRSIFVGTCGAYCHSMTATKKSDAPYLFGCSWLFGGSDEQLFHTITHGVAGSRMVPFGGAIPDADIWRIIAYLKSANQCQK